MKRPKPFDLIMGHPLVGGPVALSAGVGLYLACQDDSAGIGLLCVALLAGIGKAQQEAGAYRRWVKAWNAANPDAAPRRRASVGQLAVLTVITGLIAAYALNPALVVATAPLMGALAIMLALCFVVWRLLRHTARRPRRRQRNAEPFTVAIAAQPAPVPTLAGAYRSLPRHCGPMLGGPR